MALKKLAHVLFAAGLTGLGILSLINGDFAMNWQPVPDGIPLRVFLAYLSGTVLTVGGAALLLKRTWAAWLLTLFTFSWLLLLQVPRVAAHPTDPGVWLGFGENTLLVTGGWTLCILLSRNGGESSGSFWTSDLALRIARSSCALLLPVIGYSHFKYATFTAQMVPAWIPAHLGFAYLTGAGHMAAGIGMLTGVLPRLAATAEAAMISCFVLLLHLPGTAAAIGDRLQWTMLCIATAYAGAAWAISAGLAKRPWIEVAWLKSGTAAPQPTPVDATVESTGR